MFNIDAKPTFTRTVTVADAGSMTATYRPLDDDELAKFNLATVEGSVGFLRAAIVSISDLVAGDGAPVVYGELVRDRLLKRQYVRAALARGYFDAVSGATLGN
jgi:hypothetical protein